MAPQRLQKVMGPSVDVWWLSPMPWVGGVRGKSERWEGCLVDRPLLGVGDKLPAQFSLDPIGAYEACANVIGHAPWVAWFGGGVSGWAGVGRRDGLSVLFVHPPCCKLMFSFSYLLLFLLCSSSRLFYSSSFVTACLNFCFLQSPFRKPMLLFLFVVISSILSSSSLFYFILFYYRPHV